MEWSTEAQIVPAPGNANNFARLPQIVVGLGRLILIGSLALFAPLNQPPSAAQTGWAFEETFDNLKPAAPSQSLLPRTFDYVVTHRTHPTTPDGLDAAGSYGAFMADHGMDCAGPPSQHTISGTTHRSNGASPDASFYICNDHLMSAMGDVEGYSVSAFWPRQEFDFSGGGVLEWEVNLNAPHDRSWWEVLIAPREQLQVGAARDWLPIDETYPASRLVLTFSTDSHREIEVGTRATPPDGVLASEADWAGWAIRHPGDPALTDRKIRRTMRVELQSNLVRWSVELADGAFDTLELAVPGGLPFTRGLVLFRTHGYTPNKDGNTSLYTFHWDTIRFNGPQLTPYEAHESGVVVNLEANGNKPIGSTATQTIDLPRVGANPVLFGQTHGGMVGQVLLSVNGGPNLAVQPHSHKGNDAECWLGGWRSFRVPLNPAQLKVGVNTFRWTVGPRPACGNGQWFWDGFSIKGLEVQLDGVVAPPPNLSFRIFAPLIRR